MPGKGGDVRLDANQMRVFLEVVRAQSYTGAARRLHVSQSAVSHTIGKLEATAGVALVTRRGRGFALTDDGAELYGACERMFGELEAAERRLAAGPGDAPLRATLGATVEFGTTVIVRKLAPFLCDHPELHVDFVFSHDLLTPLLHGDVDLAVDCAPLSHPSLARTPLFREKYAVIAAPGFARRRRVRAPRDLAALPALSLDPEAAWWERLRRALPPAERPVFRRVIALNHLRGIIHAAIAGLGVGLVPKYAALRELANGDLVELFPELPLLEDTFCVYQKRARAPAAANRLLTEQLRRIDASELGDAIGAVGG
jgi:DNA-binding transcriptional LysR family regulator